MRLFHFSDDPEIGSFEPRPVLVPAARPAGQEWLNGPLVWAIDEAHEHLYLFPRACPRILIWATPTTSQADRDEWFGDRPHKAIAFVERAWLERLEAALVYRYEMPPTGFLEVGDIGMWVSPQAVQANRVEPLSGLPRELSARNVELRVVDSLVPLKGLWRTSLHASGIRLRNAQGWAAPTSADANPERPVQV